MSAKFRIGDDVFVFRYGQQCCLGSARVVGVRRDLTNEYADEYCYAVEPDPLPSVDGDEWTEACLRLKHRPADETWDEMIERLKRPVGETV